MIQNSLGLLLALLSPIVFGATLEDRSSPKMHDTKGDIIQAGDRKMRPKTKAVKKVARKEKSRPVSRAQNRAKLSTTVAAENYTFLQRLVSSGRIDSIARAVDLAITHFRRVESRLLLDRATAAYFDSLGPEAQQEENAFGRRFRTSGVSLDFDLEP